MDKKQQFNIIYQEHYPKVFRLCKGYFQGNTALADDASQEVFIKIWEKLDTFRKEANISTWIYRIAVNTCLLHLRKKKAKKEFTTESFPILPSENYSEEKEIQLKKMYDCIQKLDETGKIIILMVLEGLEYDKISDVVGIKEESLRVRIHRIKKNLTQCVQQ